MGDVPIRKVGKRQIEDNANMMSNADTTSGAAIWMEAVASTRLVQRMSMLLPLGIVQASASHLGASCLQLLRGPLVQSHLMKIGRGSSTRGQIKLKTDDVRQDPVVIVVFSGLFAL